MSSTLTASCGGKKIRRKTTKKRKIGCGCKKPFSFFTGFIKNKHVSSLRSRTKSQKGGFIPSKKNISKRIYSKNAVLNTNQKKISKQSGGVFGAVPPFTTNSHSFANVPYDSYNNIGSLENPINTRIFGGTTNPTSTNTESTSTAPINNTTLLSKYSNALNNNNEIVPNPILV